MPEVEDVRTIKVGLYRSLIEVATLLDKAWVTKDVGLIKEAMNKNKAIIIELRKDE